MATRAKALRMFSKNVLNLDVVGMSETAVLKDLLKKKYDIDADGNSFVSVLMSAANSDGSSNIVLVKTLPEIGSEELIYVVDSNPIGIYTYDDGEWVSHGGEDMLFNTTYSDLVSLVGSEALIPGAQYRITDFVTKINGTYDISTVVGSTAYLHYAKSAEHPFDLVVTALDTSTLDEHAVATCHSGDLYFADNELEQWDIKYTIENNPLKYSWADTTNGKGVITYMKDEFGNEAHYDFKNVMFLRYAIVAASVAGDGGLAYHAETQPNRYGSPYHINTALESYGQTGEYVNPLQPYYDFAVGSQILGAIQFPSVDETYLSTFGADWYYTFDYYDGVHSDASLNLKPDVPCVRNKLDYDSDVFSTLLVQRYDIRGLGGTVFEMNNVYDSSQIINGNEFGISCYFCTFGNNCSGNKLSDYCYGNTFGDSCYHNTFAALCDSNMFGGGCHSNKFDTYCHHNAFLRGCLDNTFGANCQNNIFGSDCYSTVNMHGNFDNEFTDQCVSITLLPEVHGEDITWSASHRYVGYDSNRVLQIWNPADRS